MQANCNSNICATHLMYAPPTLLIKRQNGLTVYCFCIHIDYFCPCERSTGPGVQVPPTLLITRQNGLTGYCLCTQVDPFGPCDKSGIILTTCLFTPCSIFCDLGSCKVSLHSNKFGDISSLK